MEVKEIRKRLFTMSSILGIVSLGTIYVCVILEKVIPVMGKMASQFSIDAGYSSQEYSVDFSTLILVCTVILLLCIALSFWAYISESKGGNK